MSDEHRAALTDYVEKAKAAGMSYEQVREGLISGGWDAAMVDQMLPEVFGEPAPATPPAAMPATPPAAQPAQPPAYAPPTQPAAAPPTYSAPAYPAAGDGLGAWLSKGWAMVSGDAGTFILATLVMVLLFCTVICAPPMMIGFQRLLLKKHDGKPIAVGDLFEGFQYFAKSWGAFLIIMLASMIVTGIVQAAFGRGGGEGARSGMMVVQGFSTIWGWVVGTFTLFMWPLIADDREGPIGALTTSINTATGNFLIYLVLVIVCQLIAVAGVIACGIGILFTAPVAQAAMVACYRSRFPAR